MLIKFLGIAVLFGAPHFFVCVVLLFVLLSVQTAHSCSGGKSGAWEAPAEVVATVLTFPSSITYWHSPFRLNRLLLPERLVWNSMLWGCTVSLILRLCQKTRATTN